MNLVDVIVKSGKTNERTNEFNSDIQKIKCNIYEQKF